MTARLTFLLDCGYVDRPKTRMETNILRQRIVLQQVNYASVTELGAVQLSKIDKRRLRFTHDARLPDAEIQLIVPGIEPGDLFCPLPSELAVT